MKLNSKISILIIGITIVAFLGISIKNSDYKPQIENIKGDIGQLNDININLIEDSYGNYFDYKYTLNKENIPKEKYTKKVFNPYPEEKNINLIDVTSGEDLITYIGYEVYFTKKKKVNLIIYERKNNKESTILSYQGKDTSILDEQINKKDFSRRKINIKRPKSSNYFNADILASNRYKGELYIASKYFNEYENNRKNSIEISKLNVEKNNIESIKTINLKDKIKYENINITSSYKCKDKFYILINAINDKKVGYSEESIMYLLEYSIDKDSYEIVKIDTKQNLEFVNSRFENNKLDIIMSNKDNGYEIKGMEYDLNAKEKTNEYEFKVEKSNEKYTSRKEGNTLITDDKIYLTLSNDSNNFWENENKIYVIDKNNQEFIYEGNLKCTSGIHSLEFEQQ